MNEIARDTLKRLDGVVAHVRPVMADLQATVMEASGDDAAVAYLAWEAVIAAACGCAAAYRQMFAPDDAPDMERSARVLEKVASSLRGKREGL